MSDLQAECPSPCNFNTLAAKQKHARDDEPRAGIVSKEHDAEDLPSAASLQANSRLAKPGALGSRFSIQSHEKKETTLKGFEIHLQVQARAHVNESIEQRHAAFIDQMLQLGPPLGMKGLTAPGAPSIAPMSGDVLEVSWFKYPIKGLKLQMTGLYRGKRVGKDLSMNDDRISIDFKTSNKALHYASLLKEQFPAVIEAYRGYRARAKFASYSMKYTDMFWNQWEDRPTTNETYWRLRKTPGIDIDGRNNIYTLEPAVFWDSELCRRALGYWPEEVIRRLSGHALLVLPLLDGVYVVFNDDPLLTYEAFVDMNGRFKQLLGIE